MLNIGIKLSQYNIAPECLEEVIALIDNDLKNKLIEILQAYNVEFFD